MSTLNTNIYLFIRPVKEHIYNQFEFLRIFRIHAVSFDFFVVAG